MHLYIMLDVNRKLRICIVANFCLLVMIALLIFILNDGTSKYFRTGWHDDLVMISVPINTLERYLFLLFFIALVRVMDVVIGEIAQPIIGFNIYNPDKMLLTNLPRMNFRHMAILCIL